MNLTRSRLTIKKAVCRTHRRAIEGRPWDDVSDAPRLYKISICLVGFENHKAHPDFGDDSGFWLRVSAADAMPFVTALKTAPDVFVKANS
jgi:hypothetical protein